jgi:hypothetical protein
MLVEDGWWLVVPPPMLMNYLPNLYSPAPLFMPCLYVLCYTHPTSDKTLADGSKQARGGHATVLRGPTLLMWWSYAPAWHQGFSEDTRRRERLGRALDPDKKRGLYGIQYPGDR